MHAGALLPRADAIPHEGELAPPEGARPDERPPFASVHERLGDARQVMSVLRSTQKKPAGRA